MRKVLLIISLLISLTADVEAEGKQSFFKRLYKWYAAVDTNYVVPQKYPFTAMMQVTENFDNIYIKDDVGHSLRMAPNNSIKVGPYFGYDFLFVGYQFSPFERYKRNNQDLNLNFYIAVGGIDLYWKRNSNRFRFQGLKMNGHDVDNLNGQYFDGLNHSTYGLNLYYLFNHKKYSHRVTYAQVTQQKRSAGSFSLGLGYNIQEADLDYDKLYSQMRESGVPPEYMADTTRHKFNLKYHYLSVLGGYGYNFVLRENLVFNATGQLALGYIHYLRMNVNSSDDYLDNLNLDGIKKFKFDGTIRLGLAWCTQKYFIGSSAVFRCYTFDISSFNMNNYYTTVNIYAGIHF